MSDFSGSGDEVRDAQARVQLRNADDARVSEPPARVTGGKAHRTERVRTDELAAGDVVEYSSGSRYVVLAVGPARYVGGSRSVRDVTRRCPDGSTDTRPYVSDSRWDRLTESEKARLGYPTAEHDVPSVREPRESAQPGQREYLVRVGPDGSVTVSWPVRDPEGTGDDRHAAILDRTSARADYLMHDLQMIEDGAR